MIFQTFDDKDKCILIYENGDFYDDIQPTSTHTWSYASYMKNQGWGRIINVSGLASRQTGSTIGSMRNVAVTAMTKNLADELGPAGINVTVVHPGPTRTERTPTMIADAAKTQGISIREAENQMAEMNSVRRIIDAEDVAHVVTFLASPKSLAINGDSIAAGGGLGKAIYY